MGKQRANRYAEEQKLNYTKVLAVIIALIVVVIFVMSIKSLLSMDITKQAGNEFFALYEDKKWGVIDNIGNIVISPSYEEMIIIPDSEKDVFICTYDVNEQTGEYKTKVLNKKSKEILTEYQEIQPLENYDEAQNLWYEEDVLKAKQNGKYGLITLKGKKILDFEYDDIYTIKGLKESLIVEKDGKLGLVDDSGRIIINAEYTEIYNLGTENDEGYITVDSKGKYGIISYSREHKLENEYEYIEQMYGKDLYVIKENGKQKLINSKGEKLLEAGYDEIKSILLNDTKGIIYIKDAKYGIMGTDGKIILEPQYDNLRELDNGYLVAQKDGKYGIIDIKNNIKLPFSYTSINYNKEVELYIAEDTANQTSIVDQEFQVKLIGILSELNEEYKYIRMRVGEEYQYYNLKCEDITNTKVLKGNTLFLKQENGKYGYVNAKGEIVVDYIYDDATEQNIFGYVAVKKDGLWGSLDSEGKEIIKPTYRLEDNIIIDFIGKWHLGEDLNMKYYCEK